jgi:putative lipoic acid-binding regulatory protein
MSDDPGEQLKFPLSCQYRIIAFATSTNVEGDINSLTKKHSINAKAGKGSVSKNGSYQTWTLNCTINDLETLRLIGNELGAIDGVKMVL